VHEIAPCPCGQKPTLCRDLQGEMLHGIRLALLSVACPSAGCWKGPARLHVTTERRVVGVMTYAEAEAEVVRLWNEVMKRNAQVDNR